MARFCSSCGTQIADGVSFCPACGKPAGQVLSSSPTPASSGVASAPAPVAGAAAAGGLTDNVAGLLAYITFIPAILFLILEPYNKKPFVRFHSFQSIFLTIVYIVCCIAVPILSLILAFVPILGHVIAGLLWLVVFAGFFIVWIVLLIKAYQGQMWKLPVIGDIAEKQANA